MKIQTTTVLGLIIGAALGIIAVGRMNMPPSEILSGIRNYAWWIVVLSMLVPLYDYVSGMKTTMVGMVTKHPYRQSAGFFTGLAVGMGLLLLIAPRIPI